LEIPQRIEIKPGDVRCPRCRRADIVPSMPRGIADLFMEGLGRVPQHCRSCGKRFYVDAARAQAAPRPGENPDLDAKKKAGA
jgi:hypothetical protein